MLSPYQVLGLKPGCNEEELRSAYKKRALETHPDKGGNVDEFRSVKTAYEALLKTVPAQPALVRRPSSPSSDSSVFTPFSRPFPNVFTASAFKAHESTAPRPRKRMRTLEETIEAAFASIPRHRTAKVPVPAPKKVAKPQVSPVASPKPKVAPKVEKSAEPSVTKASVSEDSFAAKLWGRLLQLTLEKRSEAISELPQKTKERLEAFLREKKRQRSTKSDASETESESSTESSSSTSDSEAEAPAASKTAPANAPTRPASAKDDVMERLESKIRSIQDKAKQRAFVKGLNEQTRLALEKHIRAKRGAPATKQSPAS